MGSESRLQAASLSRGSSAANGETRGKRGRVRGRWSIARAYLRAPARRAARVTVSLRGTGDLLHRDARYGMNLVPLRVVLLLHEASRDGDVRADRRDDSVVLEPGTRWFRVGL